MKKKATYDPERRTHIAHARMNDDEWTLFMSQLDQLGLSQSEFIRQAIFTAKVNVTVQPVFQSLPPSPSSRQSTGKLAAT